MDIATRNILYRIFLSSLFWISFYSNADDFDLKFEVMRSANNHLQSTQAVYTHFKNQSPRRPEAEYFWALVRARQGDKEIQLKTIDELEQQILALKFSYCNDVERQKLQENLAEKKFGIISNYFLLNSYPEEALFWKIMHNKENDIAEKNDRYPVQLTEKDINLFEAEIFAKYTGNLITLKF